MRTIAARSYYIDILRLLATIAVIVLHVNAKLLGLYNNPEGISIWLSGNFYGSLTRWCVPIFIILSGALLLTKEQESPSVFYQKRAIRIVLPFVFWSFIYLIRFHFSEIKNSSSVPLYIFLKEFLTGPVSYHLWYVYLICVLYLIMPMIKSFLVGKTQAEIKSILMVWFGISFLDFCCTQIWKISFEFHKYLELLVYAGYLILGYYLYRFQTVSSRVAKWIFFVSLVFTFSIVWIMFEYELDSRYSFYEYLSPNVLIMAASLFIMVKNMNSLKLLQEENLVTRFLKKFSALSFGIYLIHILIMSMFNTQLEINRLSFMGKTLHPFLAVPIASFLIFLTSTLIIYMLSKIPYLNKVII